MFEDNEIYLRHFKVLPGDKLETLKGYKEYNTVSRRDIQMLAEELGAKSAKISRETGKVLYFVFTKETAPGRPWTRLNAGHQRHYRPRRNIAEGIMLQARIDALPRPKCEIDGLKLFGLNHGLALVDKTGNRHTPTVKSNEAKGVWFIIVPWRKHPTSNAERQYLSWGAGSDLEEVSISRYDEVMGGNGIDPAPQLMDPKPEPVVQTASDIAEAMTLLPSKETRAIMTKKARPDPLVDLTIDDYAIIACRKPTLLEALAFICVAEHNRVVTRYFEGHVKNPGALLERDTEFEAALSAVVTQWIDQRQSDYCTVHEMFHGSSQKSIGGRV